MTNTGENAKIRNVMVHSLPNLTYTFDCINKVKFTMQNPDLPSFSDYVQDFYLYDVFFDRKKYTVKAHNTQDAKQIIAKRIYGDNWEDKWEVGFAKPASKIRYHETPDDYQANDLRAERRRNLKKDQLKQTFFDL